MLNCEPQVGWVGASVGGASWGLYDNEKSEQQCSTCVAVSRKFGEIKLLKLKLIVKRIKFKPAFQFECLLATAVAVFPTRS